MQCEGRLVVNNRIESLQRLFIAGKCPSAVIACLNMNAHMFAYAEDLQWLHVCVSTSLNISTLNGLNLFISKLGRCYLYFFFNKLYQYLSEINAVKVDLLCCLLFPQVCLTVITCYFNCSFAPVETMNKNTF